MTQQEFKHKILKDQFGHKAFRPLQEEAVDTILSGRDLLMILPTGGGKSLSYQLPTLMMRGTTVVVSPLLALMHDQVSTLKAQRIRAEMLSSMQSSDESSQIVQALLGGELQFLYVSPERLNTDGMRGMLNRIEINFFVLDEAHCISEWGHEFRGDYRALEALRSYFPNIPIAAFTATATEHVQSDIISQLRLNNPNIVRGTIFRSNLTITCAHRAGNGYDQLSGFLQARGNQSGIVYTLSRKNTETLSAYLQKKGFNARAYHAGLSTEERTQTYHDFIHDDVQIIVATIAFGMGIDKSNIRFVVHMSMPKTIENYYQEMGRAGRDGDDADVLLLFSASDVVAQQRFMDEITDPVYKDHLMQKLMAMSRLAGSEACRHKQIAAYFGDTIEPCGSRCDNCLEPDAQRRDITTEAQMFLSAIYRSGQRFGKAYIVDILRGSSDQRVLENGHDKLSVYGIGLELSKKQWFVLFERLLELEAITSGEYHVLFLTKTGEAILKGREKVQIKAERLEIKAPVAKKAHDATAYDEEAFNALRALRKEIADEQGVPAYVIFNDKTLKELSVAKPHSKAEMLNVGGIGEVKFERYGEPFLELCQNL